MNRLIAFCFLLVAASAFGANPSYQSFRGANGITVTSNPPNGTIIIDGSTISGSAAPGGSAFSVQSTTNGTSFYGNTQFQYIPYESIGQPSESGNNLLINNNHIGGTQTNMMNAFGFGTLSAHELSLISANTTKWGITAAGDFNPVSDIAAYSIGTIGLNRRPFYVNAQSTIKLDDRDVLSKSGNELSVGNNATWTDLHLIANGATRIRIANGGNVGIGTQVPTAHLTVSNDTAVGAMFAVYASNNPAPSIFVNSNSLVGFGTSAPAARVHIRPSISSRSYFRVDDTNGTPRMQVGIYGLGPSYAGFWIGDIVPDDLNYGIIGNGSSLVMNAPNGTLTLGTAGLAKWNVNLAGHFLAGTDNTYDIGASGATRPRDLFLANRLTVGGEVVITNSGNGLKIGPGNATLTNTLYASATLDFPSTVAGTVSDLPITVAGAADGDIIALGEPSGSIGPLTGVYNAWASNGVVYVRFANNNLVTAQDPASGTFKVRVDKFK